MVEIAHKPGYLRGRTTAELTRLIRTGAAHAGKPDVPDHPDEVSALAALVGQARDGDVVAMMTHADREEVDAWLVAHGASRDDADVIKAKVLQAQTP